MSDFTSTTQELSFNPSTGMLEDCVTVAITDDLFLESVESFTGVLMSNDPDINIRPNNIAIVNIFDDDSKCISYNK